MRKMGYKSPIQLICANILRQMEDGIFKAVQECDIRVDRDELIRALQYDRGQYEKGYADGIAAAEKARPVVRGKWRLNKDGSGTCKQCGWTAKDVWDEDGWQNFCGQCGADMRGDGDEAD